MDLERIGKYEVVGRIGVGSSGEVFKARDGVLNRLVAVKVISAQTGSEAEVRTRFLQEAQSAARLNHPNIATVYELGQDGGHAYMAMELLDGTDLDQLIAGGGVRGWQEQLRLMEQVADGLAFAHAKGVLHRALAPHTIHVLATGQPKIKGFELASLGGDAALQYLSPEQLRGGEGDARSDVFSIGAVFYQLLSTRPPFVGDTPPQVLESVHKGRPALQRWAPELPAAVARVVDKALSSDPDQRFQNGGELREALRLARKMVAATLGADGTATLSRGGPAPLAAAPKASRSRAVAYAGGLAALLALAAGGLLLSRRKALETAPVTTLAPVPVQEQVGALTEALVAGQLDLAQESLRNKDYKHALAQAEQALARNPANAVAAQVASRSRAALQQLDTAARAAVSALDRGDTERAAVELGKVLALDPRHPVVDRISGQLDRHFRAQALEARSLMRAALLAADGTHGIDHESMAGPSALAREGNTLLERTSYAAAARKFLDARDGYDRARAAAEAESLRQAAASAARAQATPAPAPVTVAAASAPPTPAPVPVRAPTAAPTVQDDTAAIRTVLTDFARAIQNKDLALYKSVKPTLSPGEEQRLREAFRDTPARYEVGITVSSVRVDGPQAAVRISRRDTVGGRTFQVQQTLTMVKSGSGAWTIRSVE